VVPLPFILRHGECLPGPGRVLWYDVSPFDIYQLNFALSYHLIPVHLLHSAIMAGYYSMHLFPVSASSISFHRCYCTCILSCGCVGLLVRRYCCEFLVCCHCKIGYRILNCIMNLRSFIFGFYLSLGIPQFLFKVIFCCSYFVYSFLFGIRLCWLLL